MNFNDYLDPISFDVEQFSHLSFPSHRLLDITKNTANNKIDSLKQFQLAIIGVPEDRESQNKGTALAADAIRSKLFELFKPTQKVEIIDLGNIKQGKTIGDTYFALSEVVSELFKYNIIPIIIGGTGKIIYGNYLAYQQNGRYVNIVSVSPQLEMISNQADDDTYLHKIIINKSNYLFNFSNIGYQSYYVSTHELDLMNRLYFDYYRLGFIKNDIAQAEPIIRDADIFNINISSIRQSDASAHHNPSPNGFFGDEACQLSRYAGLSDRVTSFGIYDVNPSYDNNNQTVNLAAQIIWYFIDGFTQRKNEYPIVPIEKYKKFIVTVENLTSEIIFYKSDVTDRWWLEIPISKFEVDEQFIVSCSYDDYRKACNQEIPDKWWRFFQKLN